MRKSILLWSSKITLAIVFSMLVIMILPVLSYGLTHLGGLEGEPLIGMSGIADSALLMSRGTDTLLVINTTAEPSVGVWDYLDNLIAIAIAVGLCFGVLKLATERRGFSYRSLSNVNTLRKEEIMTVATMGIILYAMAVIVLGGS